MLKKIAPAKINLFLHLTGRRADGYHLLESVFAFTKRGDTLTFERDNDLSLTVSGPFAKTLEVGGGANDGNLIIKAAKALQRFTSTNRGARIGLEKNLPIAAGIGGGSADAAAALKGLVALWALDISDRDLKDIALTLGADVPACLAQKPAFVSGIGEYVSVLQRGDLKPVLLLNPQLALSTPTVFNSFKASGQPFTAALPFTAAMKANEPHITVTYEDCKAAHNDLLSAAVHHIPAIEQGLGYLRALPGVEMFAMSGSGATIFAVFEDAETRNDALMAFENDFPTWWLWPDEIQLPA